MKASRVLKYALGGLALAAVGAFIVSRFERFEEDVDVGFRGQARTNPLLAFERLAERMGMEAESRAQPGELPDADRVLVWQTTASPLPPREEREIIEWVARGGHLVLLLASEGPGALLVEQRIESRHDELPFQDELGFDYRLMEEAEDSGESSDEDDPAGESAAVEASDPQVFDLETSPEVALTGRVWLEDRDARARMLAGDPAQPRALTIEHEKGRATIVASDGWATNEHIDEHEHARAAWELVRLGGTRSGLVLVHGESRTGLFTRLLRDGWMVLASGAAFLALWLWRRGSRFGPRIADAPAHRRDFSEHVAASGEFLWRHGASQALLGAPRREVRQRMQKRRPDLEHLQPAALHTELARATGLSVRAVVEALESQHAARPDEFARQVEHLVKIREEL